MLWFALALFTPSFFVNSALFMKWPFGCDGGSRVGFGFFLIILLCFCLLWLRLSQSFGFGFRLWPSKNESNDAHFLAISFDRGCPFSSMDASAHHLIRACCLAQSEMVFYSRSCNQSMGCLKRVHRRPQKSAQPQQGCILDLFVGFP